MNITVLNADDHPILRKGVTNLIQQTIDMEWVGSAENGQVALEKIRAIQPDVAVLDVEMPHMTGMEVAKTLLAEGTKTQFIILTLFKEESLFRNALAAGIKGYLLKESSEQEIVDAIRSVAQGRAYVNANLTHWLIQANTPKEDPLKDLSAHEINILKLIARQKTTPEIAEMLFISPKTVANHRRNIGKKLKLSGAQNGLLKWAMEHRAELL
ncbi:MAG: response regulator transcription factor [Bacteroidota bacterium]